MLSSSNSTIQNTLNKIPFPTSGGDLPQLEDLDILAISEKYSTAARLER